MIAPTDDRDAGRSRFVVLVGVPGAGKSTYARRLRIRSPGMWLVSTDTIRETLYPGYDRGRVADHSINHSLVFRLAYRAITEALDAGRSVVFDATNLTTIRRRSAIIIGQQYGTKITAHFFNIPVRQAIRRCADRARPVPPGAIMYMAKLLEPPTEAEGFEAVTAERPSVAMMVRRRPFAKLR